MQQDATHPLFRPASWRRSAGAAAVGLVYFLPVLWMLLAGIKSRQDTLAGPLKLLFVPTFEHYRSLFTGVTPEGQQVFPTGFEYYIFNSLFICGTSVLLALALGLLAAYGFARLPIRGTSYILFYTLALRMIPPLTTIIPLYVIFSKIGLGGSYLGIILVYTAFNLPFAIWMMRGFLADVPVALEEAALLDGLTRLQIIRRIVVPVVMPGIASTAIFTFVFTWNEYLMALMLTAFKSVTVPVTIAKFVEPYTVLWGQLSAAVVIQVVPMLIVVFLLQRHIVRGMTLGAVK